ncbi:MAG TPA: DUF3658 domain-containing protein [Edaphocola sp.]|nr:DUF3658 domain-containing protein [Edaphocola sp.]
MHTIHILTEASAKKVIEEALEEQNNADTPEVMILQDDLHIGPLQSEDASFPDTRYRFHCSLSENGISDTLPDLDRLMAISTRLSNNEDSRLCFWMAANAKDVCTYYWLLHYLKKHSGKLSVINIAGLPFLNENNQLFYPVSIADIPAKEIRKTLKLQRQITPSEWETDAFEWKQLREQNSGVRLLTNGKKIEGRPMDHFDETLLRHCSQQARKQSSIIQQTLQEIRFQVPGSFLQSRLTALVQSGKILLEQNKVSLPIRQET